jgi:hypothetical protein
LYAAVRAGDEEAAFVKGFLETANATCFKSLIGIVPVLEEA